MPIMITGADPATRHSRIRPLLGGGGEVRILLPPQPAADDVAQYYRSRGCKIARGGMDDEGLLESALEQVHTVVHLGGGPMEDPAATLDDIAGVVLAAVGAGCRRMVWASWLGADQPGNNDYLIACAEAESLLADAPLQSIVIRRGLTYGPGDPLTAALATGAFSGGARHAPLFGDDLSQALATADTLAREGADDLHMVLELTGPQTMGLSEFVTALRTVRPTHDSALAPEHLPDHLAELLDSDTVGGAQAMGRTGTPLATALANWDVDTADPRPVSTRHTSTQ